MFFKNRQERPAFVEAGPSLLDRLAGMRDLDGRGRLGRLAHVIWHFVTFIPRTVYFVFFLVFLRGRAIQEGMRTRYWRDLLQGTPAILGTIAVLTVGGIVLGRENKLRDEYQIAANKSYLAEDYEAAHLYFERLYVLDKGTAETRFYLGLALAELGRDAEAMHLIDGIAEGRAGGDPRANAWVAGKLLSNKKLLEDPDIRAKVFRNLLTADRGMPENVEVKANLASYHLLTGEYKKSIPYLEAAAAMNPVLNIDLATLYARDGRENSAASAVSHAEAHLEQVVRKDPTDVRSRLLLVKAKSMKGEFDQVLEILYEGKELDPQGPFGSLIAQAHLAIYDRTLSEKEPDPATLLAHLRAALRSQPTMTDAIVRLIQFGEQVDAGGIHPVVGVADPQVASDAKDLLMEMLVKGEQSVAVHMALGLKAWRDNDFEAARMHFEAGYDLDPSVAEVANNLAWILTHQKKPDPDRALAVIETVLERHPQIPRFRDTRGEIYLAMERWDDAIRDLEFALVTLKDDPRIHQSLAKAYTARGQKALAAGHLKEAERLEAAAKDVADSKPANVGS